MKKWASKCFGQTDERHVQGATSLNQNVESKSKPPKARFVAEFVPVQHEEEEDTRAFPCVSFEDEPISRDKARQKPPVHIRVRWRKAAIWVTVVCIIVSVLFALASFVALAEYGSDSALAMAFDCLIAIFDSLVVLWRFRDEENGKLGPKRERFCCICFGFSFIISGTITSGVSVGHIIGYEGPDKSVALIMVALTCSFITYAVLALMQLQVSAKLRSSAMLASSIDSGLSGMLIFGLLLSDLIYDVVKEDPWYLDHAVAIGVSVVSILCGIKILVELLIYEKLPMEALAEE